MLEQTLAHLVCVNVQPGSSDQLIPHGRDTAT
jgi:hypothetical protein